MIIELSQKYNISLSNFNILNFANQFQYLKKSVNNQIFIDFYDEEREVA